MPMDGALLYCLGRQTERLYQDQRVEKIYQNSAGDVLLRFSMPRETPFLLLSAHPREGGIVPLSTIPENPLQPPLFAMVLRKHLGGARLRSVRQEGLDRILHFEFIARDELGDPATRTLILEVMGKHSNLILVDDHGIVIDAVRKYNHLVSRHREILPGQAYILPPLPGPDRSSVRGGRGTLPTAGRPDPGRAGHPGGQIALPDVQRTVPADL